MSNWMNIVMKFITCSVIFTNRYKEGRYPENMEHLSIQNTSPLNADVSFCYQNDSNASTFLLDPPNMFLKPGEAKVNLIVQSLCRTSIPVSYLLY